MNATSASSKGKKVLLVVTNMSRRNLRATVFRNAGIDVVCASRIADARELWHPLVYDLVLFDGGMNLEGSIDLCADMKAECPQQRVAWLVGEPEFLSAQPLPEKYREQDSAACTDNLRQLMANACEALPRRGGFLEARWRMALGRSARPGPIGTRPNQPGTMETIAARAVAKAKGTFSEAVLKAEAEQDNLA